MICELCDSSFSDINIFISHLSYQHNISHNFRCSYKDCCRIFHKRHAFKRHLMLNHVSANVVNFNKKISSENIIDSVQYSDSNESEIIENKKLKTDVSTNCNVSNVDSQQNEKTNSFYYLLDIAVNRFISKLYSISTLSRSVVQEIIMSVSDLLSSGILTVLKRNIESDVPRENCCKMFTSLENIFNDLDTEYKRFKHFENSSCFVKPISMYIGSNLEPKRKRGHVSIEIDKKFSYLLKTNEDSTRIIP